MGRMLVGWCMVLAGTAGAERGIAGTEAGPSSKEPQKWAVVIGVGNYEDKALGALPNAVRDARAVYQALVQDGQLFSPQNVALMVDDAADLMRRPTRSNILTFLHTWLELAGSEDSLLIYFAGHGIDENGALYLMPLDGRTANVSLTGIAYRDFEEQLEHSKAKLSLIILDACHSGAGRGITTMTRGMMDDIEKYSEGRIVLASCKENEFSHEYDKEHGAFTHFLLEALQGAGDDDKDGLVSAKETSNYTFEKVRRWSRENQFQQTPRLLADISGDFILAKVRLVGPREERPPDVISPEKPKHAPGEEKTFEGIRFVWIPPGVFEMGSLLTAQQVQDRYGTSETTAELWKDENPQHTVEISAGFWMSRFEVTNGQFRRFADDAKYQTEAEKRGEAYGLDANLNRDLRAGCHWRNPGWEPLDNLPVVCVTWNDAVAYVEWLSKITGDRYRLPTEAEWEYACRAGSTDVFPWGHSLENGEGWLNGMDMTGLPNERRWPAPFPFRDGYWNVAPIGSFKSNSWGLYDMLGNVFEWCQDWYDRECYMQSPRVDPPGPAFGSNRVERGGSWDFLPVYCRAANRDYDAPDVASVSVGFRICREEK